jgi:hypothetical protein
MYTIGVILLLSYIGHTTYALADLRKTNAFLVEMTEYQANILETISQDIQPIKQFRGLTANRSFSCSIGHVSAP